MIVGNKCDLDEQRVVTEKQVCTTETCLRFGQFVD